MPKETGIIEDVGYVELELWNSVPSMPRLVRVKTSSRFDVRKIYQ